jgi:hypothetical protein
LAAFTGQPAGSVEVDVVVLVVLVGDVVVLVGGVVGDVLLE